MTREELTPHLGQRIKCVGPYGNSYGTLTRLTERTADFIDERDNCETHTELYRIFLLPCSTR